MSHTPSEVMFTGMTAEPLVKRTHCYVMRPKEYQISGCACGNADPDWSEYKGRLWCPVCQIDFVPASNGIFDGPIPVHAMELMGIDMRMYDIETGEILDIEAMLKPKEPR